MAEKKEHKWAVENFNPEMGLGVRVIETPQEWTADLIRDTANQHFKATERPSISTVIKLY